MDQPGLEVVAHQQALAGLRRMNRASRALPVVWRALRQLAREVPTRPLRVLDLACGGGDVAIGCAQRAGRAGLLMEFHGCDKSDTAIFWARAAARGVGCEQVRFSCLDVLNDELPGGCDIVMSNLFLHHLADHEAVLLLQRMAAATHHAVLVDDLVRSPLAWGLAWLGCRLCTRSPVVHVDGPRSVRAAFTVDEAKTLSERAGLGGAWFARHWPARFLMQWVKP